MVSYLLLEMKISILEKIKGTLRLLMYLYKNENQRPIELIKGTGISSELVYKFFNKFKDDLIEKSHDKERDILVWRLTKKGKEIVKFLMEIEKRL